MPRLIFNAKTLKLCSKIKVATRAQQTAGEADRAAFETASKPAGGEVGDQLERQRQRTSALGLIPDSSEMSLQVRKLPETDIVIAR